MTPENLNLGRRSADRQPIAPEVRDAIGQMMDGRLHLTEDNLTKTIEVKFGQLHQLINDAFPDGDPHGHRAFHEKEIRDANRWDRLKAGAVDKLVTGGVLGVVGFVLMAAWEAFKREVTK